MAELRLTVHRSAHQIGGNSLELATDDGHRLILDAGRPLDAPEDQSTGLLPPSLDVTQSVDAILLSHPHQDHYGLLNELPADWPVHCGPACETLVKLTAGIFGPRHHPVPDRAPEGTRYDAMGLGRSLWGGSVLHQPHRTHAAPPRRVRVRGVLPHS